MNLRRLEFMMMQLHFTASAYSSVPELPPPPSAQELAEHIRKIELARLKRERKAKLRMKGEYDL